MSLFLTRLACSFLHVAVVLAVAVADTPFSDSYHTTVNVGLLVSFVSTLYVFGVGIGCVYRTKASGLGESVRHTEFSRRGP